MNTTCRQKTSSWTDLSLQQTLDKITNECMKLKVASKVFGIPSSSLRDHLYGRTTSKTERNQIHVEGTRGKKKMDYLFKMQDLGHPLTPLELHLKVATTTQKRKHHGVHLECQKKGGIACFAVDT